MLTFFNRALTTSLGLSTAMLPAILAASVTLLTCSGAQQVDRSTPKRLVAYYLYQDQTKVPPYNASTIPYKKLTHLIHVALVVDQSGSGAIQISPNALEAKLIPKAHAAGVRVLVCVQGPAQAFSKIAANADARSRLANELKDFVDKNRYDGVDIDWEVPQTPEEIGNDVLLMQSLRTALPAPQYLLSMATPSEPGHWGNYDFAQLTPIVDFYNVMTYDFHGPWTPHTGHNSPLFANDGDPGHDGSIDESVNLYLNRLAVPPEKINLGTAFYGYEFPAASLHAACDCDKTTMSRDYGTYIKSRIDQGGWSKKDDTLAMAPYLIQSTPGAGFITYDDAKSTARKVTYALEERNLGGVFMWELSGDYDGKRQELLDSMRSAFIRAQGLKH